VSGRAATVKVTEFEVCPPVFTTVIVRAPAAARLEEGITAVNWVDETNVVVRFVLFSLTTDPEAKFVPLTVRVTAAPPTEAEVGLMLVIVGAAWAKTIVGAKKARAAVKIINFLTIFIVELIFKRPLC